MKHVRRCSVAFEFINRVFFFVSDVKQINDLARGCTETLKPCG